MGDQLLHWSMMNEDGMYRGSLLLSNVTAIEVRSSTVFTLHVVQGRPTQQEYGSGNESKTRGKTAEPAELTFESKNASVSETWVTGLKFLRDAVPVAGVPHVKRRPFYFSV